jgi:hypothetical protein
VRCLVRRGWRRPHKGKHFSADREWKWHDQEHEERHLCYEQEEDLCSWVSNVQFNPAMLRRRSGPEVPPYSPKTVLPTYETVI